MKIVTPGQCIDASIALLLMFMSSLIFDLDLDFRFGFTFHLISPQRNHFTGKQNQKKNAQSNNNNNNNRKKMSKQNNTFDTQLTRARFSM